MKGQPVFLTVDEGLEVHRRTIEAFGGSPELRNRGLLESAVAMPAAQFGGEYLHESLAAMAAAYLFHLCKNRPFVDGNERVSLAAAETFILLNRRRLVASDDELATLTLGVADGSISKREATEIFESHVKK